jgi:hypothetical protein
MGRPGMSRDVLPRERRKLRGLVLLVVTAAFVWAVAIGGCVAQANAEPYGEQAAPSLQARWDESGAWLSGVLKIPLEPRRVLVAQTLTNPSFVGEFWNLSRNVYLLPSTARDVFPRGRWPEIHTLGITTVVHEWLHRADTYPCWRNRDGMLVEEGIVQALTADLLPAYGVRFWRNREIEATATYEPEVRAIRAWSTRYTGSPHWRTRDARLARRALWAADCEQRAVMLARP